MLGISTSGYYAWRKARPIQRLKAVYWQQACTIGALSLVHDIHDLSYSMSERTVGKMLEKKLGLRSKIAGKCKHTSDSNHRLPTRQFTVTQPSLAKQCVSGQQIFTISLIQTLLAVLMCNVGSV